MVGLPGESYECPIARTVSIIGKKWTLLVLKELYCAGRSLRFNELKRNLDGITSAILSKRLQEMEEEGLISRSVKTSKPPLRVEYSLTSKGRGLQDIMEHLKQWGVKHGAEGGRKLMSCDSCLTPKSRG
ncbi:MAG: helix-turn-helix domain-containing protein [Candidatus Altiarchaeota archaeon]